MVTLMLSTRRYDLNFVENKTSQSKCDVNCVLSEYNFYFDMYSLD